MRLAVPPLVGRCVGQPEVGSEVDDFRPGSQHLGHEGLGGAVRQPEEHSVDAFQQGGIPWHELLGPVGSGQARVEIADVGAGL